MCQETTYAESTTNVSNAMPKDKAAYFSQNERLRPTTDDYSFFLGQPRVVTSGWQKTTRSRSESRTVQLPNTTRRPTRYHSKSGNVGHVLK